MSRKKEIILLLIILTIAVFFRFWKLGEIPPGLYPDVAINGNDALDTLKTKNFKVFYPENNGREGLFIWLLALSFSVFGPSVLAIKIVPAFIGILTIIGFYLWIKELFNYSANKLSNYSASIALLSSFFLATSFWHTNFSRLGFRAIMVPFCLVFFFYFLFRAIRARKTLDFVFSGIFFGLGFYTYPSFRMAILILVITIIFIWQKFWREYKTYGKMWKTYFKGGYFKFDLWLLIIFLVALPIGLYFLSHPQDFMSRAAGVSIFSQTNPPKAFLESLVKHLGMFNFYGDPNWRHNFSGSPQLPWPLGILFLIGIFLSFKEVLKKSNYQSLFTFCFLLSTFFVMLLPGILTVEGLPHSLRVIGTIPAVYIFAGLGAFWFIEKLKSVIKNLKLFFIFYLLFFIFIGYLEYDKYFVDWGKNPEVEGAFSKNYVDIGKYLNSLPPEIKKYVVVNADGVPVPWPDGIPMPSQTPIFIERTIFGEPRASYLKKNEVDKISFKPNTVIIPMQFDEEFFKKLRELHPNGEVKNINKDVWIYKIK